MTDYRSLIAALRVLVLDQRTRAYLEANDPKALAQACAALDAAGHRSTPTPAACGECNGTGRLTRLGGDWGTPDTSVPCWRCQPAAPPACGQPIDAAIVAPCERPAGHGGPCRAYSLETGGAPPAAEAERNRAPECWHVTCHACGTHYDQTGARPVQCGACGARTLDCSLAGAPPAAPAVREPSRCPACDGQRWLICEVEYENADGIRQAVEIERCDMCAGSLTDAEVRAWPEAQAALEAAERACENE